MYHPQSASARMTKTVLSDAEKSQDAVLTTKRNIRIQVPRRTGPIVAPIPMVKSSPKSESSSSVVPVLASAKVIPVLGAAALNTHFFDGKVAEMVCHIRSDIDKVRTLPSTSKTDAFNILLTKMRVDMHIPLTQNALRCFNAIASMVGNYDSPNNLYADDLLYLLYEKIVIDNSHEHASLLASQLDEMISGLCPQGRTTRLLQVLIMLKDDLTPTSKVVPLKENIDFVLPQSPKFSPQQDSDSETNEVVIE